MSLNQASQIAARVMGSAGTEPELSPIQREVSRIEEGQQKTHALISELEHRLESVLHSGVKPDGGGPDAVPGYSSPLHAQLGERTVHAFGIADRLSAILDRLTV